MRQEEAGEDAVVTPSLLAGKRRLGVGGAERSPWSCLVSRSSLQSSHEEDGARFLSPGTREGR